MLKNLRKELHDAKLTASSKFNQTFHSGTSDPDFDARRAELLKQKKNFKRLQRSLTEFAAAANAMKVAQEKITKNIGKIAGKDTDASVLMSTSSSFTSELDRNVKMLEGSKLDINSVIDSYLFQFSELEKRIDERYSRLSHADKTDKEYRHMEQKSAANPAIRTDDYSKNSRTFREGYDALNAELKRDINGVLADRTRFLAVVYPLIADAQTKYISGVNSGASSTITESAARANIDVARNYAHCITPNSASVMFHKTPSQTITQTNTVPNQPTISQENVPAVYNASQPTPTQYPAQQPYTQAPRTAPRSLPTKPSGPSRPLPVVKPKPQAVALYDFVARDSNELTFKAGDMITIWEQTGDWWQAELNGKRGTVPSNYVQLHAPTTL